MPSPAFSCMATSNTPTSRRLASRITSPNSSRRAGSRGKLSSRIFGRKNALPSACSPVTVPGTNPAVSTIELVAITPFF